MRRTLALFLVVLGVAAATAQQRGAGGITVRGQVLGPGGEPLAGARLSLLPLEGDRELRERLLDGGAELAATAEAKSDAGGAFAVTAPAAGFWTLRVEAPGHLPHVLDLAPLLDEIELPVVTLPADRPLEVEVQGPDGRPVPGAWVAAEAATATGLRAMMTEDGWRPTPRHARPSAPGPARLPRGAAERLTVRAYVPGMREAEAEVTPGKTAVTLRLTAAPAPQAVEVRDAAGRPAAGVLVLAGKGSWPIGRTRADGRLEAVFPGAGDDEQVQAVASGGRRGSARLRPPPPAAAAGHPARPAGPPPATVITLPAAVPLAGQVVDARQRAPIPGALVWWPGEPAAAARTDAGGQYRLAAAPTGQTGLGAAATGYHQGFERVAAEAGGASRGPSFALEPALRVHGSVVDAATKKPLAGVEVRAREAPAGAMGRFRFPGGGGEPIARTGANGRFDLRGLAYDTPYELHLRRAGYAPRREQLPPIPPAEPSASLVVLDYALDRGRRAVGRVVDGEQQPIGGAKVTLRSAPAGGDPRSRMRMMARGEEQQETYEATTGARGEFALAGLPAGRFDLEARAAGFAPRVVPGLEIPAGDGEQDLGTVLLQPGEALEGRVTDPQGQPVAEAEVRVAAAGRDPVFALFARQGETADAWTDVTGWFRVADLVPGQPVTVVVTRKGYSTAEVPGVKLPAEPLAVTLQPAIRVSGRVVDPGGEPVPRAQVMAFAERQRGGARAMRTGGRAQSDEEGRFVIEEVEPGTLRVTATAEGRQPAELGGIAAPPGRDVEGLELVLAPGATVEGRVTDADGRPVPGVLVNPVEPDRPGTRMMMMFRGGTSDGDGWYRIEGLPPGPRSIAAEDDQGRRAVGDLDVRPGSNRLDLRFRGGVEVAGRVVDAEGTPVADAEVALAAPNRGWGEQRVTTGAGGGFVLEGVGEGEYRLLASKEGYAAAESDPFKVAGAPVTGLEIRLQGGGAITGRVLGLEPDALPRVMVRANRAGGGGSFQFQQGVVDFEGRYRFAALAAGEWRVSAELPGSGRRADGRVTLEPGAAEAVLDLDFGAGLTLSGRVVRGAAPVAGAVVDVVGSDVADYGSADTDREGSFRITGLEAGTYDVTVRAGGAQVREQVALQGDREVVLELEVAAVAGRVIDTTERAPIAGASVHLEPAEAGERSFWWDQSAVATDAQGRFRLAEVAAGRWRLRVEREGYGAVARELEVRGGADVEDLEVALEPTSGLVVEVVRATGGAPSSVLLAVLDGAGQAVTGGFQETGENGRVRLSTVPAGSYEVLAAADGLAVARAAAAVPGPPVRLVLEPAGVLDLRVPALQAEASTARVAVRGVDGTPFRMPEWGSGVQAEWQMGRGRLRLDDLPPGAWTVEVRAASGRVWSGAAAVQAGQTTELVLE